MPRRKEFMENRKARKGIALESSGRQPFHHLAQEENVTLEQDNSIYIVLISYTCKDFVIVVFFLNHSKLKKHVAPNIKFIL